ncbi:MAG: hypothetical protein M1825_006347 [Sarcosagium campestre]|nr:MAG: hypothetical protein M1825_006347 [Sarcosagium campestre]
MSPAPPYTYISCPCVDVSVPVDSKGIDPHVVARPSHPAHYDSDGSDDEERTFDPRAPRSNYSLYPLEHLLYCEDCHQIRCPRCVLDEVVCLYCPNCLFEVPSSLAKHEGNRCARNCFQCPICISPLSVNGIDAEAVAHQYVTWALSCAHCNWSSLEVGMKFEKPNNIAGQMAKYIPGAKSSALRRHDSSLSTLSSVLDASKGSTESEALESKPTKTQDQVPEVQFANLKKFYDAQLAETASANNGLEGYNSNYSIFNSPSTLARIMNLYAGPGSYVPKKVPKKPGPMREAYGYDEGIKLLGDEHATVKRVQEVGWDGTTTARQRAHFNSQTRFISDLRPRAFALRTKRSKRCRTCRHILVKPEAKVHTMRFRIRLIAMNYLPSLTLTPFPSTKPLAAPTTHGLASASAAASSQSTPLLPAHTPTTHLLTLTNPLFEPIRITLATPPHPPHRSAGAKVTLLCPQVDVGANTDVWDEALGGGGGSSGPLGLDGAATSRRQGHGVPEAGKVWERGRNWARVGVEVVPGTPTHDTDDEDVDEDDDGEAGGGVLEVPVRVRVEWEERVGDDDDDDDGDAADGGSRLRSAGARASAGGAGAGGGGGLKEKRELSFWCVIGVGRVQGG